jgi:hypothetical protein
MKIKGISYSNDIMGNLSIELRINATKLISVSYINNSREFVIDTWLGADNSTVRGKNIKSLLVFMGFNQWQASFINLVLKRDYHSTTYPITLEQFNEL